MENAGVYPVNSISWIHYDSARSVMGWLPFIARSATFPEKPVGLGCIVLFASSRPGGRPVLWIVQRNLTCGEPWGEARAY